MTSYFLPIFFIVPAIFIAFYIPGKVVFGTQKSSNGIITFACSMIIGLVLWGWQGYILGYLHIRFLSYIYLLVFISIFIYKKYYTFKLKKPKSHDFLALFLIVLGTIAQIAPYYKIGLVTDKGIYLPPFNYSTDHIGHTSLINEMVTRFPPFEPGMYGILVANYHYWFNLVTADLIGVFHLPLFQTQYLGMYPFVSFMVGVSAYVFSTSIIKSKAFIRWLLFILYLGGDATYWLSFITTRIFDFQVPSTIDNSTIFLDNPPRAFSVIILFIALYLLFHNLKNLTLKSSIIISILIGTLVGFKVYTGLLALSGLGFLAIYQWVIKRDLKILGMFLIACILSLIIFIPVNKNSGGIFLNPIDRARDFITYKPLGLSDWELRFRIYLEHKNYPRLIQYGIMMTVVYFFAQFGVKLIGLIPYKKMLQQLGNEKKVFIYGSMLIMFFIGLFFNQAANPAESYNFFIAGALFLTILTSLILSQFLDKKSLIFQLIFIVFIAGVTMPRWIYVQINYFPFYTITGSFYGISSDELASFNFLKKTGQNSLILVLNKNNLDRFSPFVATLTNRHMFLSGQRVLRDHNTIDKNRVEVVEKVRNTKEPSAFVNIIKENKIDYVYLYKNDKIAVDLKKLQQYKVFENKIAFIYKI